MIDCLSILNFQKHAKLEIKLDPCITIISGPTDSGKSSIIRAIRWCCLNRPGGEAFLKDGESLVQVKLKVDHCEVVRQRGGEINSYFLDCNRYTAFGQGIPESVADLLNVDDINFSGQHDPPFWFMLSPGEVSRELNQIINLGLIDSTLSNLATELRKSRAEIGVSEERLQSALIRRDRYSWVKEAEHDWREVEKLEKEIGEKRERIASIASIIEKGEEYQRILHNATEAASEARIPISQGERVERLRNKITELKYMIEKIVEGERELCEVKQSVSVAKKEMEKRFRNQCPLCGKPLP